MKFFLFLLLHLLLFDSPQGSAISRRRSIRALNTTLETNFNGTYERRNPCTNAEIETTSYVASHEFRHHTEENNWSDYTNKCSSIISSFLQALGNLVYFNHKRNGIFNFHINTSISQKQVGPMKSGKRMSCDTLPTITIEATDCELSPRLSCKNLSSEQFCQDQDKEEKDAICEDSHKEDIYKGSQILSEKAPKTPNFNQNSAVSTSQCRKEDEISPISIANFLPETKIATSLEPEIPTASTLFETKNSPQGITDPSETPYFGYETTPQPITDKESFYSNQFYDLPFGEQQSTAYSKQLFDDDLDRHVPDSKFLSDQQPNDSIIFPDQIPKATFNPQEPIPIETYQPKNTAVEISPVATSQNEKSFEQSLQSGKQRDNFEKTQTWPNADVSSETSSYLSPNYLTKYEEASFNQIANEELPQVPNLIPSERQFMDYDGQTPALGYSARYLKPPAQMQPKKNTRLNIFADQNGNKVIKERTQAIDYPNEFFNSQPVFEGNLKSVALDDNRGVPLSDDLSISDIRKPLTDPTTWTLNEPSPTEKPLYDANNNEFFSTPSPERPPFYFTNESPFLKSKSQKSVPYFSEENSDESNTEEVTDSELLLPSEQYQSIARPESQSLLNSPDQYDNDEEAKHIPESNFFDSLVEPDSKFTTRKPYLQSYSMTPENQDNGFTPFGKRVSPHEYPTGTTSNQKFSSSYDSTSDYELFSPPEGETFSDEYLTTLPPEQDSSENYQKILTTMDPYQNQSSLRQKLFPSALKGKLASTFPGPILNDNAMSPSPDATTLDSDIYTSRTPAPISFDEYQDSLYSKPDVESLFTTPVQSFNENTYEPVTEPNFTNGDKIFSEESQPTTPIVFGIDQLKERPSSYSDQNSDFTLEQQPLNYASDISLPAQNTSKSQPYQFLEKREDSLPGLKQISDRQYNAFSAESLKTENFMNTEVEQDSLVPQLEQYPDDNVLTYGRSNPNPDSTPYFSEDFPERSQTIFSPQPVSPYNKKELFTDRSSFRNTETTSSPDFSTTDDYFEPTTPNNYQKVNLSAKFSEDSDARPKKFFSELFTTPLPPFSLPSEDFSSPSNYKTILENPLTQSQAEESLTSLDQSVGGKLSSQFEEPERAFSAPFMDVNKFDSDFQTEKQSFELETTGEKPSQSTTQIYKSQSDQPQYIPLSYPAIAESLIPYDEKQYVAADNPKIQAVSFPEQKSSSKPLTTILPEYGSTTSKYQPTNSYRMNDSDNFKSLPALDQRTRETIDRESALDSSNPFSDFYPKEASANLFPSAERRLIEKSDSPKEQTEFYFNNQQPSSNTFEPQSLISTTGDDQSRSSEFQSSSIPELQPESIPPFSDEEPLAIFSEKTPLDITSKTDSLALPKNQKLKSSDFQTPDSLTFAPYSQPQKVPSYSSFHHEDFSKDSQSSSVEDLGSVVFPESHLTKPETYRNINRSPNRQTAAKFNTFQSPQRGPEAYNQFPSAAPLQPTKYYEKEVIPNNDYSSTLKSTSKIQPSVYGYNKQVFSSYSGSDFAPKPQPYQPEPLPQTVEEYSDITTAPEREIPFDIDQTTPPSMPKVSPLLVNEQTEYSSSLAPEQQLKPQSLHDKLPDIADENIVEKPILLPLQTSNFEKRNLFEVKSDKSVADDLYPFYKGDAAGADYNQPNSKGLDYLDDSFNTHFDVSTPNLSSPTQPSVASMTPDSVPSVQFRPNDFRSFSRSPISTSYQLNNNSNKPSQRNSATPLHYSQSEEEISFITDNVSPQARPTTAIYNDKEITEISPTPQPQPQETLNFADQFSDDNILEQLSDSPDQQYQITPNNVLSSESSMEQSVSTQRNHPPLFFQTQQLDVMTGSPDQTQNNFDSKLSSQASNASHLHTTTTTQSQHEPSVTNPERLYNSQERFSRYNSESQPTVDSNNRPVSIEYHQDPSIHSLDNDQFSSNVSPQEQRYFSEVLPYPEVQGLAASRYDPQALGPRDKFQTQPYITRSSRYPNDVPPINSDKKEFPSVVSRHSATQRFNLEPYPMNFPNQYPNYKARAHPNVSTSNSYNNEPAGQSNRASPQYFTSDAMQGGNSFESLLPISQNQYRQRSEVESSLDQTIKNADSSSYDDYDQALSSQLSNEKLLEYDEHITPEFYAENSQTFQAHRQQDRSLTEEDPHEGSDDFLTEADPPMGFSRKADSYGFQDRSSPNAQTLPLTSRPAEKEPHSNPLLQTLESHLTFPFQEHLRPPVSYASFEDTEKESLNDSFPFDPQNQNKFRDASAIPPYSEGRDSELDFVNYQRSQPLNGVDTAQDVTNTQQLDSHALVSDPNTPSNKPGEDCVSWFGQNPTPLLCPFDPVFKGNMTAPSYYILISKLPVHDNEEEQFKVEKVYLGDGMPLNCTLNSGETFPTSLCTPIPFSEVGTVRIRTKSDFA